MKVKFSSKTPGRARDTYQGSQHLEIVAGGLGYISHPELISELKTGLDYIVEPVYKDKQEANKSEFLDICSCYQGVLASLIST